MGRGAGETSVTMFSLCIQLTRLLPTLHCLPEELTQYLRGRTHLSNAGADFRICPWWLYGCTFASAACPSPHLVSFAPRIELRALSKISPGDELTVSYVDFLNVSEERRKQLKKQYYFDCACEHCKKQIKDDLMLAAKEGESKVWFVLLCPNQEVSSTQASVCLCNCGSSAWGHSQQEQSQVLAEAWLVPM